MIPALEKQAIHRAAAFGDIVINVNNGKAILLKNTAPAKNWITVAAPQGSRVELKSTGLPKQIRSARTDSSYLAANDPRVHFAAGTAIESLTIKTPGRPPQTYGPAQVKRNALFRP